MKVIRAFAKQVDHQRGLYERKEWSSQVKKGALPAIGTAEYHTILSHLPSCECLHIVHNANTHLHLVQRTCGEYSCAPWRWFVGQATKAIPCVKPWYLVSQKTSQIRSKE